MDLIKFVDFTHLLNESKYNLNLINRDMEHIWSNGNGSIYQASKITSSTAGKYLSDGNDNVNCVQCE